ncbi:oligopeptide/dipeptide ABC transporter ATP-binding protein [Lachnospiraceae bacterium 29-84]
MSEKKVLLHITDLKQYFPVGKKQIGKEQLFVKANDGISLDIYEGETFGLVGESGCGKSTFGRTLLQLYRQTAGRSIYYGRSVEELAPKYVSDIFNNLPEKKRKCEEARERAAKLRAEWEKMPEGTAKNIELQKLNEAETLARNELLDITALIGGLYVADDLKEISQVYVKEYNATLNRRKYNDQITTLRAEVSNKRSAMKEKGKGESEIQRAVQATEDKIKQLQSQVAQEEKQMQAEAARIQEFKKQNKAKKDFGLYESYMDSGINLANLTDVEMRFLRRDLQLIFQDPYSSLNPRMTVGQIIGEGLLAHHLFKKGDGKMQDYIMEVMEKCGLASYFIHRYPHQFSGGQRQRIGIARSLAVNPKFVVCDEAVSALDVSIQSQIINLLLDLKEQNHLTYLFISHDLSVIKYISDRIGVMYLGNMVELCETAELFERPYHPYTEALLSAIPTTDMDHKKEAIVLEGDIPSPIKPPRGCKFNTRCQHCTEICKEVEPKFEEVTPGHFVACHHKLNVPK